MQRIITIILLLALSPAAAAGAYKWTDAEGRVHYGDRPPVDQDSNEVRVGPAAGDKAQAPPTHQTGAVQPPPTVSQAAATDAPGGQDECAMLKGKLEKYKQGQIDFSYESATGRKIVPAKVKVIEAYEGAIARACGEDAGSVADESFEEETTAEDTVTEAIVADESIPE